MVEDDHFEKNCYVFIVFWEFWPCYIANLTTIWYLCDQAKYYNSTQKAMMHAASINTK